MEQRKFKLDEEAIRQLGAREAETREALELRRLQAVRLYGSGAEMAVVQQVSGASRRTVQRWVDHYEAKGLEGLKPGWRGGNHRQLSEEQHEALQRMVRSKRPSELLLAQAEETLGEFWSVETVRRLVEERFGVRYRSVRSYHSLLAECGLSYQRAEGIYRSRPSEAVIAEWEGETEKK